MTDTSGSVLAQVQAEAIIGQKLVDLLRQEEQLLISNELEALLQMAQVKSQLVGQFALCSQARYALLHRLGLPGEDRSMALLLEQSRQPALQTAWTQFLQVVTEAKQLNQTNGLLLQRLATGNQNALTVLQGRQATPLYGPNGQKGSALKYRSTVG